MAKATYINVSGTMKKCKAVFVNVGGTMKKAKVWKNVSGVWKLVISYTPLVRLLTGDYITVGSSSGQAGFNNNESLLGPIVLFEGMVKNNNTSLNHALSSNYKDSSNWWSLRVSAGGGLKYRSRFSGGTVQEANSSGALSATVPTYVRVWYNIGSNIINFTVDGITNSESHSTQHETSANCYTYIGRIKSSDSGYTDYTTSDLSFYQFIGIAGSYYSSKYSQAYYNITDAEDGDTALPDSAPNGTYNGTITGTTVTTE